jgi:hypothetical protein
VNLPASGAGGEGETGESGAVTGTSLGLVPAAGVVSAENGRTVVTVAPGAVVPFSVQLVETAAAVQGFQFNFAQSHAALQVTGWATNATDFPLLLDSDLQGDSFVAAATLAGVSAPPSIQAGSFQVTAPLAAGDYVLTVRAVSGNELIDTILTDVLGQFLEISDFGDAVIRIRGWHNTLNPCDVNDQGGVTAEDVLIIINYINSYPDQPVLPTPPVDPHPYYDVNHDGRVTPLDALLAINYVNRHRAGAGEAERVVEQEWAVPWETPPAAFPAVSVVMPTDREMPEWQPSTAADAFQQRDVSRPERRFAADTGSTLVRFSGRRSERPDRRVVELEVFGGAEPLVGGLEAIVQEIAEDVDGVWKTRIHSGVGAWAC